MKNITPLLIGILIILAAQIAGAQTPNPCPPGTILVADKIVVQPTDTLSLKVNERTTTYWNKRCEKVHGKDFDVTLVLTKEVTQTLTCRDTAKEVKFVPVYPVPTQMEPRGGNEKPICCPPIPDDSTVYTQVVYATAEVDGLGSEINLKAGAGIEWQATDVHQKDEGKPWKPSRTSFIGGFKILVYGADENLVPCIGNCGFWGDLKKPLNLEGQLYLGFRRNLFIRKKFTAKGVALLQYSPLNTGNSVRNWVSPENIIVQSGLELGFKLTDKKGPFRELRVIAVAQAGTQAVAVDKSIGIVGGGNIGASFVCGKRPPEVLAAEKANRKEAARKEFVRDSIAREQRLLRDSIALQARFIPDSIAAQDFLSHLKPIVLDSTELSYEPNFPGQTNSALDRNEEHMKLWDLKRENDLLRKEVHATPSKLPKLKENQRKFDKQRKKVARL